MEAGFSTRLKEKYGFKPDKDRMLYRREFFPCFFYSGKVSDLL